MAAQEGGVVIDEQLRDAFQTGPLGVMVTRAASRPLLEGLLEQAAQLGIAFRVFFTDEAVGLLSDIGWVEGLPEGSYAACDLSARRLGVQTSARVSMAGQYHNAMMVQDAARVVSL